MPFYEYECQACGAHHEAMQKMSDGPLKKCPECGKSKLIRLISAPVFRLKGGGWYETDFKSDKEKKRNLAGTEEATPSGDAEASTRRKAAKKVVKAKGPARSVKKAAKAKRATPKGKARPKAKPKTRPKAKKVAKKKVAQPKRVAKGAAKR